MLLRNNCADIFDATDLLLAEMKLLKSIGPHFRIGHRFHVADTLCTAGEEIEAVYIVSRRRQYQLRIPLSLRLLVDFLGHHTHMAQSAAQIQAAMAVDPFYVRHGANATPRNAHLRRSLTRSSIRVYIARLRRALGQVFTTAGLSLNPCEVVLSQRTVSNETGYRIRGSFEWVHHGDDSRAI
jgi:hypothetical protein